MFDTDFGKYFNHFEYFDAAYYCLKLDPSIEYGEVLKQLIKDDQTEKAQELKDKLRTLNELIESIQREITVAAFDENNSLLELSTLNTIDYEDEDIFEVDFDKTTITKNSLEKWFQVMESGASVHKPRNEDIERIESLLNRTSPYFSDELYLCLRIWINMAREQEELDGQGIEKQDSLHRRSNKYLALLLDVNAKPGSLDFFKELKALKVTDYIIDGDKVEEKPTDWAKKIYSVSSWKRKRPLYIRPIKNS